MLRAWSMQWTGAYWEADVDRATGEVGKARELKGTVEPDEYIWGRHPIDAAGGDGGANPLYKPPPPPPPQTDGLLHRTVAVSSEDHATHNKGQGSFAGD